MLQKTTQQNIRNQDTTRRTQASSIVGSPIGGILSGNKKIYYKRYYKKNRNKLLERTKKWQRSNRDKTNKAFIEWGKKNPEKLEAKKLRAKAKVLGIKITYEEYKDLCIKQNNLCAICKKPEITKHWKTKTNYILSIDHCHKTKKVRGLLCKKCNTSIGFFEDNIELMKNAISYLTKSI